MKHWAGILLITAGVTLVGMTAPATTVEHVTAMKWLLVFILVTSTTVGDVARSRGMKKHGEVREFHPGAISQRFAGARA